jgi:Protein of unknown function (DUF3352)
MTDDFAGLPSYDVLAAPEPESRRKPATWWVVGGVVALVAALIGGITYGAASLSGGGTQPEGALPAGAIAFAKVDLDPAAGQKVDAIRFLRKFPSVRGHVALDADLRKVLFDSVADDAGWKGVSFAKDVEPWLGQRVAVAVYSPKTFGPAKSTGGSATPSVVVALQVGDEGKARTGLDRLIATSSGSTKPGYVLQDGYALLAQSKAIAQSAADGVAKGSLAKAPGFAGDMKGLEDGIATFWFDGKAASSLMSVANLGGMGMLGAAGATGGDLSALSKIHMVYTLRFDGPNVLEMAGRVTGGAKVAAPKAPVKGFAALPASTVAAFGMSGGDAAVDTGWKAFKKQMDSTPGMGDSIDHGLAQAERQYGLHLPADLKLIFGSNLLVALDGSGLTDGNFQVGGRVTTPGGKRANSLIGRLTSSLGGDLGGPVITHRVTGDGYVVASSKAQADRMTKPAGKSLGDLAGFRQALPDVAGAQFALWVDLQGVAAAIPGDAGNAKDLKPLVGFGITSTTDGDGNGSFRARLVTH